MGLSWAILLLYLIGRQRGALSIRSVMWVIAFVAAAAAVALPVLAGSFVRARFATVIEDWNYRILQSLNSIQVMDDGWMTRLFGMGLGRYPEIFYTRKPLPITPASYRFEQDNDNVFLRLFPGNPLYFEQYVNLQTGQSYIFSAKVRGMPNAVLSVYVCEKNLLYSFRCAPTIRLKAESPVSWSRQSVVIAPGKIGYSDNLLNWIWTRPIKLSLATSGSDHVDVDDIELINPAGRSIINNGDFALGMDRWFFSTDEHLAWQVKNHWVHIYFEQGWVGVLSQLFFSVYLIASLIRLVIRGDRAAAVVLASVVGFLTVGFFGFLFDTPRISMLFYFISLASLYYTLDAARVGTPIEIN